MINPKPYLEMINEKYNRYLSQLFGASVLTEIANTGTSEFAISVLRESGFTNILSPLRTLGNVFDDLYSYLKTHYRCEYIYKNAIANKILIGRHQSVNSSLVNEFRVGSTKADIAIFNGTSTVYEIKTELDTLGKLERQISSYRNVFDKIYVITDESQISNISYELDEDIGIIALTKKYSLSLKRQASSNISNTNPNWIFDTLRRSEYCQIIKDEFGIVPDVPNTKIYSVCKELFSQLTPEVAHRKMVEILRIRRRDNTFVSFLNDLPHALKMAGLAAKFTAVQRSKFTQSLKCKIPH
jgi:hypothetical protein